MDYRLKLFQILDCFESMEGTWFEYKWKDFGITEEERAQIKREYELWQELERE